MSGEKTCHCSINNYSTSLVFPLSCGKNYSVCSVSCISYVFFFFFSRLFHFSGERPFVFIMGLFFFLLFFAFFSRDSFFIIICIEPTLCLITSKTYKGIVLCEGNVSDRYSSESYRDLGPLPMVI